MRYLKKILNILFAIQCFYLPVAIYFTENKFSLTSISLILTIIQGFLIIILVFLGKLEAQIYKTTLLYISILISLSVVILFSYFTSNMELINSGKINGYFINILIPLILIFIMTMFNLFDFDNFVKIIFFLGLSSIIANIHFLYTHGNFTLSTRLFFVEANSIATGRIFGFHFLIGVYLLTKSKKKLLIIIITLVDILFVFMTGSRQVLVAIIIIAISIFLLNNFQKLTSEKIARFFLLLLVSIPFAFFILKLLSNTFLYKRLNNVGLVSVGREDLIVNSIGLVLKDLQTFIVGIGFGDYYYESGTGFLYPHNIILEIFIETGLIGLFLLIVLIFTTVSMGNKMFKLNKQVSFYTIVFYYSLLLSLLSFNLNGNKDIFIFSFLIFYKYAEESADSSQINYGRKLIRKL